MNSLSIFFFKDAVLWAQKSSLISSEAFSRIGRCLLTFFCSPVYMLLSSIYVYVGSMLLLWMPSLKPSGAWLDGSYLQVRHLEA